ncbi:DUF2407 C-terminal domain-containing protein [Chaetomium fimeti]|uniref:DUF2407 C-terminal domain-containing protein n=1 Tax=Chaetomium fimeti TaxID=1854472 RepID=A0AAE0LUJ2_9PEZI|nr:DUF2407 C-terminal domain-containing protein [Chaetomium fimeti]
MSSARGKGKGAGRASSSSSSSPTRPPREPRLDTRPDSRPLLPRSPSALLFPPAPPPLHITIRFSIALPDIHLDIPSPQQTTVVALKHLIRGRLAAAAKAEAKSKAEASAGSETTGETDDSSRANSPSQPTPAAQASLARLRFIHNGRILPDTSALGSVLKAPPPPPISHHPDPKGKAPAGLHHQQQRVFINCSIGDALPEADLTAEATAATLPPLLPPLSPSLSPRPGTPHLTITPPNRHPNETGPGTGNENQPQPHPQNQNTTTTTPAPAGFDRLLQAGLTAPEISTLRSHFRAIHTARFAPDAMPSPDTLRSMEDAWLDGGSHLPTTPATAGGGGGNVAGGGRGGYFAGDGGGAGDAEGGEGAGGGGVDDAFGLSAVAGPLIHGMLIGFVFPLGVVAWLGKEEGVWSRRMQVFVVFGVLLSVSVGLVRELTGEG